MDFKLSNLDYKFQDFIGIYENAFTKKECKDAIKLFELYHKLGYTSERSNFITNLKNDTAVGIYPSIDLDWNINFIDSFHDRFNGYIYPLYNKKYSVLQKLQKHKTKYIKIQKTLPSEGYHEWHCEYDADEGKNRILSWILYLNDIDEGGETEFLYQSLRIVPKTGTVILFPAHFTHTHRGNPPLSKEKYIATGWVEFLNTPEFQGASELPSEIKKDKNKNFLYG